MALQRRRLRYPFMGGAGLAASYVASRRYVDPVVDPMIYKAGKYALGKAYNYTQQSKGQATPLVSKSADKLKTANRRKAKRRQLRKLKGKNLKKEVLKIKNQVKDLKLSENASLADLTYREFDASRALAAVNGQKNTTYSVARTTDYESVVAQLKYFDSGTNTIVTASGGATTDQKEFLFKSISSELEVRNNYQVDADVLVYLMTPKVDTDFTCADAWDTGIADDVGNVSARTEYGVLPTDFNGFNDLWKAKRMQKIVLAPGETVKTYHTINNINYDPALTDTHADIYQKALGSFMWLVIVKGSLSHDTSANQVGIGAAGVDAKIKNTYKVRYNAGMNFSYLYTVNSMAGSFSTSALQSHQPKPDNVAYSVA